MLRFLKKGKLLMLAMVAAVVTALIPASAGASAPALDFDGIQIGVSPMEMVTGSLSFLGIFDAWVVLALAVIFTPVLVWMVFWLVGKVRKAMAK